MLGEKMDKFLLLMWKNWILQIRHPIQTFFEIFFPVLICIFLVIIRALSDTEYSDKVIYPEFSPDMNSSLFFYKKLAYSPRHPELDKIMEIVKQNGLYTFELAPFDNADALETYLVNAHESFKVGVQFEDAFKNEVNLPDKLDFRIRFPHETQTMQSWHTDGLFPNWQTRGPRGGERNTTPSPGYQQEGFLALQFIISKAIFEYRGGTKPPTVLLQRFPYPAYVRDILVVVLRNFLAFIIILAYTYPVINITRMITSEKEKQLKESMKIMGLSNWLHWSAWFVKSLIFMLISVIIMVFVLKTDVWYAKGILPVFSYSNSIVFFLYFFVYTCATITFSFMISVFFTKASLASTFVWLIFLFAHQPYMFALHKQMTGGVAVSAGVRIISSILSNTAMGYGFDVILKFESSGEGLQWDNIWKRTGPTDDLVMGEVFLMLIFDTFLYMLIALYVEAVFPGTYGVAKKWNFIFTWCLPVGKVTNDETNDRFIYDPETFEPDPENMKAGIEIRHLKKVYGNQKVAVKDFTLNMYENQITVLLGHNGAGKTTTISMLTGMYRPTSGTAIVNGYDIKADSAKARSSLGICPQHNILFDDLTVKEHIYFYGKLKGLDTKSINKEITEFLQHLDLVDKIDKRSSTLSGGMQRKLSVAVAFCGNSKVIMLDEPTAGMDPAARRALWEFIELQKKGRTILLTTHFMDEADLLGDRIAIMSGGKLNCCGSSFFLKKKYGAGYNLIIEKNTKCNVEDITRVLRTYMPSTKVESDVGTELTYLLKKEDAAIFQEVLKEIEDNSDKLRINGYGISLTTLEEVFMKVGTEEKHVNNAYTTTNGDSRDSDINSELQLELGSMPLLTGVPLMKNQIYAMLLKRALTTMRSWPLLLIQVVLCVVFLASNILITRDFKMGDMPSMMMSLNKYTDPIMTVSSSDATNIYYNKMLGMLNKDNVNVYDIEDRDIINEIVNFTAVDEIEVKFTYIAAASFNDTVLIGLFNSEPYHSSSLALNLIMNSLLKSLNENYEIVVSNHPIPFGLDESLDMIGIGDQMAMTIAQCLSFVTACYVLFYIRERICKVKHLQFVSGVNIITFWFVSFIWDWFTYIIFFIIFLVTIICFQEDGFKTFNDIGRLIIICLYFEFAMFPIVYLFSLKFNLPSTGFTRIILVALLGIGIYMMVMILSLDQLDLQHVANILDWVFLSLPFYSLPSAIRNQNLEYRRFALCELLVEKCVKDFGIPEKQCWMLVIKYSDQCTRSSTTYFMWERPGILRELIFSLMVGVLLFILLFLIEYGMFTRLRTRIFGEKTRRHVETYDDDVDVKREKEKIMSLNNDQLNQYTLVLRNLTKYYKDFLAVNDTCLAVNCYECFGLLGVNGAGKTSTFKMITGDTSTSYGDVYVNGLDLKTQRKDINKITGYCPQFDALFDELTARETIKIFALLRGFRKSDSNYLAEKLANNFDFYQHLDKRVKDLSGGNRRKLSTAVSLIGDPTVVYLDEPTTGMDPASKRHIWDQLCKERDRGKCLILTSHSMEECEALCTRLAIMVNGKFKCLGSTQHLKNRFSPGYTLTIKLRKIASDIPIEKTVEDVDSFIKENFPSAVLKENYQQLMTYNISDTTFPWSKIFGIMETAKVTYNIEDYSLGQSSLEQVFLMFTNQQQY